MRAALTGTTVSPGIFDVLEVLGREESLARIARIRSAMIDPFLLQCNKCYIEACRSGRLTTWLVRRQERCGRRSVTTATLTIGDKTYDLPISSGTLGPDVVDITHLYGEAKVFTYDPAFTSTAACESKITYIDGDEGILLYRGYPIDQLAEHGDFIETCYLLYYGELPTPSQRREFEHAITHHTMIHEQMARSIRASAATRIRWR